MRNKIKNIIDNTERLFRTDLRYLIKGGFWLGTTQVFVSFVSFGTSVAFAHFIPAGIYGTYKYLQSIISVISNISVTGFSTSIIRASAQNNDGTLSFSVNKNIIWSIPAVFVGLAICIYYMLQGNYIFGIAIIISTLLFNLSNSFLLYGPFLSGKKEFALNSKYHIYTTFINSLILFVVIYLWPNLLAITIAYFAPSFAINWYLYRKTEKRFVKNNNVQENYFRESVHFSLANFIAGIAQNIDRIVIFQFLGPIDLAIYNFAIAVPDQMRGALKGVSRLAFPKFAEKDWRTITNTIGRKTFIMAVAIAVVTAIYIFSAPLLFEIFFPKYVDSIIYTEYSSLALITVIGTIPYAAIQAHGKTKSIYSYNIATSLVQIATTSSAIILFGLNGAIASLIFNRFFSAAMSFWLMKK